MAAGLKPPREYRHQWPGEIEEIKDYREDLAEQHWEFVQKICRVMYIEAAVHFYKHGWEDAKEADHADRKGKNNRTLAR